MKNVVFLNDYEAVKDGFSKDALLGKPHPAQFSLMNRPKSRLFEDTFIDNF